MTKKGAKKKRIIKEIDKIKNPKKETSKKGSNSSKQTRDTEKILIENFVSLQKVMVNLSVKFENLTQQISKLLDLFEISAKALAEKDFDVEKTNKGNMEILGKMDNIMEQNKTIARGLTLMHEKINNSQNPPQQMPRPMTPPIQRLPQSSPSRTPLMRRTIPGEYHKQISTNEQ